MNAFNLNVNNSGDLEVTLKGPADFEYMAQEEKIVILCEFTDTYSYDDFVPVFANQLSLTDSQKESIAKISDNAVYIVSNIGYNIETGDDNWLNDDSNMWVSETDFIAEIMTNGVAIFRKIV